MLASNIRKPRKNLRAILLERLHLVINRRIHQEHANAFLFANRQHVVDVAYSLRLDRELNAVGVRLLQALEITSPRRVSWLKALKAILRWIPSKQCLQPDPPGEIHIFNGVPVEGQ